MKLWLNFVLGSCIFTSKSTHIYCCRLKWFRRSILWARGTLGHKRQMQYQGRNGYNYVVLYQLSSRQGFSTNIMQCFFFVFWNVVIKFCLKSMASLYWFWSQTSGFKTRLYHLLAVWPWLTCLPSLWLSPSYVKNAIYNQLTYVQHLEQCGALGKCYVKD